ncbi:hypothetical protein K7W42_18005 [Deinococcus sp. HMF7604]|uniref:hypothetical protein n=1 Tax=Deinococcus betulae TaxID=2873312 RepID=UPI001CCF3E90|nr:hypothetical protein [Deinococcus betulae]MBZ9752739.1 hypothetical protein [Deinococcus betulae]
MASPKRDNAKAARALVDAALRGDAQACEHHGIAIRTLQNYRKLLETDDELARFYAELSRTVTTQNWANELNLTLTVAIRKQGEMIRGIEGGNAETISAVTGAIKALSEIAITRDVLGQGVDDAGDGDAD